MKMTIGLILGACGLFLSATLLGSCSELKKDLPAPVSAQFTAHDAGWSDPASANFHGRVLSASAPTPFDLSSCARCHAQTFSGGTSGVSCTQSGCHVDENGVAKSMQACNTCHGSFRAPDSLVSSWAPPRSLNGDTLTTDPGVGAHQAHVTTGVDGGNVACQECHNVPARVTDPGHIGTPPVHATVAFNGPLSSLVTGNGTSVPVPVYDPVAHQCSSTFCHGTWKLVVDSSKGEPYTRFYTDTVMLGGSFAPVWTGGAAQATCGSTCHGVPPTGHQIFDVTQCYNCHYTDTPGDLIDRSGKIVDHSRHVDGKIQVFSTESPFR